MRHRVSGFKLKRSSNERQRLFKTLVYSFVKSGQIRTTRAKAKAIESIISHLVTNVKRNSVIKNSLLTRYLGHRDLIKKFTQEIVPQFVSVSGGYTRLIRLDRKSGDYAERVLLQWSVFPPRDQSIEPRLEGERSEKKKNESIEKSKKEKKGKKA